MSEIVPPVDRGSPSAVKATRNTVRFEQGVGLKARILVIEPDYRFSRGAQQASSGEMIADVVGVQGQTLAFKIDQNSSLPDGAVVAIGLPFGTQKLDFPRAKVTEIAPEGEGLLYEAQVFSPPGNDGADEENRAQVRWSSNDELLPTVVCPHPLFADQTVFFRVRDLSVDGMGLESLAKNIFLLPGLELEGYAHFPGNTPVRVRLIVKWVRPGPDDSKKLLIGTKHVATSSPLLETVSRYLSDFSSVATLEDLSESGFDPVRAVSQVRFQYVNDEDAYNDSLEVRSAAAVNEEGQSGRDLSAAGVSDVRDAEARIVNGYLRDKPVCTSRIRFLDADSRLEAEECGIAYPEELGPKSDVVEISRSRIRPGYRGFGIGLALLRFVVVSAIRAQRTTIVISARSDFLPMFEQYGFVSKGGAFNSADLRNIDHHLVFANVHELLEGKNVNPITWNILWRPVLESVEGSLSGFPGSKSAAARVLAYRLIGPLSQMAKGYLDRLREEKIKREEGT